jgi:hypothetical protein
MSGHLVILTLNGLLLLLHAALWITEWLLLGSPSDLYRLIPQASLGDVSSRVRPSADDWLRRVLPKPVAVVR